MSDMGAKNNNGQGHRLRRREAAQFLTEQGYTIAANTLAKFATIGGGPVFDSYGRIPLYEPGDLLAWARARSSGKRTRTSDAGARAMNVASKATDRLIKIPECHALAKFPPGVDVVGIVTLSVPSAAFQSPPRERLFVALSLGVYELVDDELVLLKFKDISAEVT